MVATVGFVVRGSLRLCHMTWRPIVCSHRRAFSIVFKVLILCTDRVIASASLLIDATRQQCHVPSAQEPALFVSDARERRECALLRGLPHSLLLQEATHPNESTGREPVYLSFILLPILYTLMNPLAVTPTNQLRTPIIALDGLDSTSWHAAMEYFQRTHAGRLLPLYKVLV